MTLQQRWWRHVSGGGLGLSLLCLLERSTRWKCWREQARTGVARAKKARVYLAREPRSESAPAVPKVTLAFPATSFFKGFWFSNFILVHSVLWPYSLPITLFSSLLLPLPSFTTSPPLCVSSQVGLIQGATHRFTIARSLHIQFHCAQVTLFGDRK